MKHARNPHAATPLDAPGGRVWSLRLAWVLTALTLVVPPFLVWPALAAPFHLPKQLAAELLGLASVVALVVARRGRMPPPWRLPAVRAVAPFLVAAAASVYLSEYRQHGTEALWSLGVGLICLAGWSLWGGRLRRLLDLLLVPAFGLSVVGILQFHHLFQPFAFLSGEEQLRVGVTSLAGSVGDLGAFMVLPALLSQLAVLRSWRGSRRSARWRLPLMVTVAVAIHYCLVVSQTITALVAVGIGSLILWLPMLPARRRVWVPATVALLLVLLAVVVPPLRERGSKLAQNARAGRWAALLSGRTDGWQAAAFMFREHPVFGVGLGGFLPAFTPAKLALLDRGASFYLFHRGRSTFRNAHNELLEVLAEGGLVGLLAFGWGIWVLVARLRHHARDALDEDGRRSDLVFAVAGLGALAVLVVGYFPFRLALTAYPAAAFLAWILRPDEAKLDVGQVSASFLGRWSTWAAAGALSLLLIPAWHRADRRLEASQIVRAVELINNAMTESGRMSRSLLYGQIRALKKAWSLAPADVSVPLAIGGQYLLLGDGDEAVRWLETALELEPRPEVYVALASAEQLAGRYEAAETSRARASRLDPRTYGTP